MKRTRFTVGQILDYSRKHHTAATTQPANYVELSPDERAAA